MIAGDSIDKHITILGILQIALTSAFLFVAFHIIVTIAGSGITSGNSEAILVTGTIGTIFAILVFVFALPGSLEGYGPLRRYPWARVLGIILAILNLVISQLATILGVCKLSVLFHGESQRTFSPTPTR